MSIPTSFNPLGTLGGELPYVQPIMTSYTNWSNKTGPGAASFGFSMTEAPNPWAWGFPWHAFSKVDNKFWGVNTRKTSNTIITFEDGQRLKLQKLDFGAHIGSGYASYILRVSSSDNGEDWVQKGELRTGTPSEGDYRFSIEINNPTFANKYKLEVIDPQGYSQIADIELIGVYKP